MSNFNFMEYVTYATKHISKKPYAQNLDEFSTDPDMCFMRAFFGHRILLVNDMLDTYPKFRQLADKISSNDEKEVDETQNVFFEEVQLVAKIFHKYYSDKDITDSLLMFLTAYHVMLGVDSKDEFGIAITKILVDQVCDLNNINDNINNKIMLTVILWFTDRDGYKDAVRKKYIEQKN